MESKKRTPQGEEVLLWLEFSGREEFEKFEKMERITTTEISTCDIEKLSRFLQF